VMSSFQVLANGGLITKASRYSVQETIERFETAIKSKAAAGWVIFSRIDHAAVLDQDRHQPITFSSTAMRTAMPFST